MNFDGDNHVEECTVTSEEDTPMETNTCSTSNKITDERNTVQKEEGDYKTKDGNTLRHETGGPIDVYSNYVGERPHGSRSSHRVNVRDIRDDGVPVDYSSIVYDRRPVSPISNSIIPSNDNDERDDFEFLDEEHSMIPIAEMKTLLTLLR